MLEKTRERSPYVGANLQTSRTPSAIDSHCRSSYETAKRKLHSSRAKVGINRSTMIKFSGAVVPRSITIPMMVAKQTLNIAQFLVSKLKTTNLVMECWSWQSMVSALLVKK